MVIGLMGPTGVGKTAVAVELAVLLDTRIISCDSMQVYAGFPVLTNQPWQPEDRRDLHDLIGYVQPTRAISAAEYAENAKRLLDEQLSAHSTALVVGGSGLYMRAALAPLATTGPANPERRSLLEGRARREGPELLHAELAALDPDAARSIDCRNARRVIRALEGVLDGARWSGRDDLWDPVYDHPTMVVGLTMDRSKLAERVLARSESMLDAGAADEVRRFCAQNDDSASRPGSQGIACAIGYEQLWRYVRGELGRSEAVEQIAAATRRYARRQITWLRKVRGAVMIETHGRSAVDIAREILELVEASGAKKEHDTV